MKRATVNSRSKKLANERSAPRVNKPLLATRVIDSAKPLSEEEQWQRDMATLRKAAGELALRRTKLSTPPQKSQNPFDDLAESLEDPSVAVRKMSIRALYDLDPDRAATLFNLALRDGSREERRKIGSALAASGLVDKAISNLLEGRRENSYGELSLLFLVAKAGEVRPLIKLIEQHANMELRLAIVRLLASSGGPEVLSAFRRLAVNGSLPTDLQLTLLEVINQMTAI